MILPTQQNSKGRMYYAVNALVMFAAASIFYCKIAQPLAVSPIWKEINWPFMILAILLIIVIYAVKILRLYIIMMEKPLPLPRFIQIYVKTTFAGITLPYKCGDLFRMYCFGKEIGDYRMGVFGILVERYLDTVPLLIILIAFTVFSGNQLLPIVVVLAGFLLVLTLMGAAFPGFFRYVNRYCVIHIRGCNSIPLLRVLAKTNEWYLYIRGLLEQRTILLLVMSACTWAMEYGVVRLFARALKDTTGPDMFLTYMNASLLGADNLYASMFVGISGALFLLLFLIVYPIRYIKKAVDAR